jgi:hypothetical protein
MPLYWLVVLLAVPPQGDAHTTQRSKGRRRYQSCDLQSDQEWPAPGL